MAAAREWTRDTDVPPTRWFDVEDLFEHIAVSARPSGIQRVTLEIYRALLQMRPYASESASSGMTSCAGRCAASPGRVLPACSHSSVALRAAAGRPAAAAGPLRPAAGAGGGLADLVVFLVAAAGRDLHRAAVRGQELAGDVFAALGRPGDVLAMLGAPWVYLGHAGLVADMQRGFGLRLAVLVHDIIPIMRPDWFPPVDVARFPVRLRLLLPSANIPLAVSQATAADVARFAAGEGLALRAPERVIPLGTAFAQPDAARTPSGADTTALPPGSYVLFVSTLDARKNHQLLFHVWRRLLQAMPAESVPRLVFAGRPGWLVADLMRQLENSNYLGGKIRLLADLSDADLARLYRGCRFTLFPSLYEG